MQFPNSEFIRALTPISLAIIGGVIGVSALFLPDITDTKLTAAMGLAGTSVAGAAGLAQSNNSDKNESI